ncbi:hypothetical protein C480_18447 [Natrialba aegyptia DSM 13077]|uniref:Uncharacterized protein n=1 Tax=Natrialba aegyptia DSM 13077 TaxID=1227491 RepID=M0ASH2_9EURY|nr:hypothetical protein C480_18447 [Natrialba aegyptia DSM 13077]
MEWNIAPDSGVDSQTDHEFVERPCPADLGRGFVVQEPQRAYSYHRYRRRRRAAFAVFVLTERIRLIETMGQRRLKRRERVLVTRSDRTPSHIYSLYQNPYGHTARDR